MRHHMVIVVPVPTGYAGVRYVSVSLPLIVCLLGRKYMLPENVPPAAESRDLRRIRQGKVRAPRAPSLRFLVRLAMRCDSAEQLGERLRRRYQRQQQRRGTAPPGRRRVDRELLDPMLGPIEG